MLAYNIAHLDDITTEIQRLISLLMQLINVGEIISKQQSLKMLNLLCFHQLDIKIMRDAIMELCGWIQRPEDEAINSQSWCSWAKRIDRIMMF